MFCVIKANKSLNIQNTLLIEHFEHMGQIFPILSPSIDPNILQQIAEYDKFFNYWLF